MGPQSDAEVRTKICPHCADTDPLTPHESKCPQPKIGFLVDGKSGASSSVSCRQNLGSLVSLRVGQVYELIIYGHVGL